MECHARKEVGPVHTDVGASLSSVLTDADADEIRAGVESGLRGPVVIKWIRSFSTTGMNG